MWLGIDLLDGMLKLGLKVLVQLLEVCSHFVSLLRWNRLKGHFEFGVEALVGKERSDIRG